MTETPRLPRNGLTIRELAKRIGRSERTVKRYTSEPRAVYEAEARARHERIVELRATGMSIRAIAAEVGCSRGTVEYALKKAAA